jgi:ribosomal protein L29
MQAKELRSKTTEELVEQVKKMRDALKTTNMDLIGGKDKNTHKSAASRRDIARVLSVINEKEILKEAEHE